MPDFEGRQRKSMEREKSRPRSPKTTEPMVTKIGIGDDVGDPYPVQNSMTIRSGIISSYAY